VRKVWEPGASTSGLWLVEIRLCAVGEHEKFLVKISSEHSGAFPLPVTTGSCLVVAWTQTKTQMRRREERGAMGIHHIKLYISGIFTQVLALILQPALGSGHRLCREEFA
jgi:hypothetical protein